MLNKMDSLYEDIFYMISSMYKIQNVTNENIQIVNDVLCDEEYRGFDKNLIEELETITAFCINMINYNVHDEFFFKKFQELIPPYKEGKYDNYLFDKAEDKKLMDEHIRIIEEYIEKQDAK